MTIAIIGSLERILMRMTRDEVTEWGLHTANPHDTAIKGKEPYLETAIRSYKLERDTFNGKLVVKILYDFEKLFDTIHVPTATLIDRLTQANFPKTQMVLGMIGHRVPRIL